MDLKLCGGCRRHVALGETTCPFCGTACAAIPAPRPTLEGRLSRAAVFAASAVIAAPACVVNSPPPQYQYQQQPPPPPNDPPPGDPPPDDSQRNFAQPPPDHVRHPPPAIADAVIRGRVTNADTGAPWPNAPIELHGGPQPVRTTTDRNGAYVLTGLPAGQYTIVVGVGARAQRAIQVIQSREQIVDVDVPTYVRREMPKPYGAPPARRRIV